MKTTIEQYFDLQQQLFDYFGYVKDWKVIPLESHLGEHWMICGPEDSSSTKVYWSPNPLTEAVIIRGNELYSGTIYTQRFLPKWVYRGKDFTMIAIDTHSDGNQILMIFENALECKNKEMKDLAVSLWTGILK